MANTPNLDLATINRSLDAATKLVGEWIDDINDVNGGNMTKIDRGFGRITSEGTSFRTDLLGDGSRTSFSVSHNRNTFQPSVAVFDETTRRRIMPEVEVVNSNTIMIHFVFPVQTGRRFNVSVN